MVPDLVLEALAVVVGAAAADRAQQLLEARDDVWEDPEEGWELGIRLGLASSCALRARTSIDPQLTEFLSVGATAARSRYR